MRELKDYRDKELKYLYYSLGILMLIMTTDSFTIDGLVSKFDMAVKVIECVAISSVASLFAFLGDSIISSFVKDKLIGLIFIPKPGETIFTRISKGRIRDNRFTITDAQKKYANIIDNIPNQGKTSYSQRKQTYNYENAAWYKIYNSKKESPTIQLLQRDSLLCRDINIAVILFSVSYLLLHIVFASIIHFSFRFIIILLIFIVISNVCSHIKMHRFVNTIIAIDIAEEDESK